MNATTTAPTALAARQAELLDSPDMLMVSRDSRSGGEWATLRTRMWEADPRCVICGEETVNASGARRPEAVRLMTLIPCGLTDDNGGRDRFGYVPGNLAIACHACVHAANDYGVATGEAIVFTPDALTLPQNVWLAWPALAKRRAVVNNHTDAARLGRQRLGLPF